MIRILISENVELDVVGASDAEISVSKKLKADLAGACSLNYKGLDYLYQ